MKKYLIALAPFLIYAILKLINSMIGPAMLNLQLRLEQPDLFLKSMPYIKTISFFISFVSIFLIILVGYRISKNVYKNIWFSATAGISFYMFTIVFYISLVLLSPLINAILRRIILGLPLAIDFINFGLKFDILKSLLPWKVYKSIFLWSLYGMIGGLIYSKVRNRTTEKMVPSDI